MKPAQFDYHRPASVEEAVTLLGEYGDEAKVLAGGQSLVPAMNFRLAQPAVLVDINRVPGISYIEPGPDGGLRIGATTRQRAVEVSPLVAERAPLIHLAMPWIAHVQIRNRGTIGGSVAHADPAAELPALMLALAARMRVLGPAGERWLEADEFFTGLLSTALQEDELLVELAVPPAPARTGCGFLELARRHGDYALAGVAAVVTLTADDVVEAARIALFGVADSPVVAHHGQAALVGQPASESTLAAAAELVGEADIDPASDVHATSAYRRHLAKTLTRQALARACAAAREATA
ncbi:MAG: xanthine dehydrogenase family protein subunit M [Haliangiales bacterium]